jgi:transposase
MRKREKPFREERMSQERTMEAEQRRAAKEQMIALMQAGHRWQEAAAQARIQVSRSTAYRLLRLVRTRGKAAFQDGRHGHPTKLRMAERTWLESYCRASPATPSRVVQTTLQERFGIQISLGYLNQVRADLGLGSRTQEAGKKTRGIPTD